MTIKTTDMETVYDLGQKMIEQVQKGIVALVITFFKIIFKRK